MIRLLLAVLFGTALGLWLGIWAADVRPLTGEYFGDTF